MRKNIIYILLVAAALFSCKENNKVEGGYYISGEIANGKGKTVFLQETKGQQTIVIDSCLINDDDRFEMSGIIAKRNIYSLRVSNIAAVLLLLGNKEIEFNADLTNFDNYTISGSNESMILKDFNLMVKNNYNKLNELKEQYRQVSLMEMQQNIPDSLKKTFQIDKEYVSLFSEQQRIFSHFIDTVQDAILAIYATQYINPESGLTPFFIAREKAKKQIPDYEETKIFLQKVETISKTAIGAVAAEINLPDVNGKNLALSSFKGKVVLIDFWASWCRPCRMENPNLVKTYHQFKNKDFIIYSVSYDRDKTKWLEAIKQDKLVWDEHVLNTDPQGQSPTIDYQVFTIPTSYLIDKEGKIAGKNLRGEEVNKKIELLLN